MGTSKLSLVLLVSLFVASFCAEEILVTPNHNSTTNCTSPNCLTLSECALLTFESNTTLTFLNGLHRMNTDFSMSELTNVALRASPGTNVTVDCEHRFGFSFTSVHSLVIEKITFVSCGYNSAGDLTPGIWLFEVNEAEIIDVTVSYSTSTAFHVAASIIEFTNLVVRNNQLTVSPCAFGAGILKVNSSNVHFSGTTKISDNKILDDEIIEDQGERLEAYYDQSRAVFVLFKSIVAMNGDLYVTQNSCPPGIVYLENVVFELYGDSWLSGNNVSINGALSAWYANVTIEGDAIFSHNSGSFGYVSGISSIAGLLLINTNLQMAGTLSFISNHADVTSMEIAYNSVFVLDGNFFNIGNNLTTSETTTGYPYSTMILRNSEVNITGFCHFSENRVSNAALRVEDSYFDSNGETEVIDNFGSTGFLATNGHYCFFGSTLFENNPGALFIENSHASFFGQADFIQNGNSLNSFPQGAINAIGDTRLEFSGSFRFIRNTVSNPEADGGAIYTSGIMIMKGEGLFEGNRAHHGGALFLHDQARMIIDDNTSLVLRHNLADKGGCVYISRSLRSENCNYSSLIFPCLLDIGFNTKAQFLENKGTKGGSVIHIDVFSIEKEVQARNGLTFLVDSNNTSPRVATDSYKLCFCNGDEPACDLRKVNVSVRRGERFTVRLASVTPFRQENSRSIRSVFMIDATRENVNGSKSLRGGYSNVRHYCTNAEYQVFSSDSKESILLQTEPQCTVKEHCLVLNVELQPCPEGFVRRDDRCECDERMERFAVTCNIDSGLIEKTQNDAWIGAYRVNGSYEGLILSVDCPFDYCKLPPYNVSLSNPDDQCHYNRAGILCGQCKEGYHLSLGSSKCKAKCSNSFYAFLLIAFALLGILLVAFIFLTQFTVANGIINGMVIYANAVSINQVAYGLHHLYFVDVFIAWINLDFGIETCFHTNLGQLGYTVWQFVFPIYLLLIVVTIIIVCHCSLRASKFFSNLSDPVAVLATLVLLSYSKILRTAGSTLVYAHPRYPEGATDVATIVWRSDGNIAYGVGSHGILLIISSCVIVFLFAPYTFVLFSAQWLNKSERVSNFFNRFYITNALNSYHAALKPDSRYWIGAGLCLRWLFLLTFVTAESFPPTNLLVISAICLLALTVMGWSGGIYINPRLNLLEASYFANLAIFSVGTFYVNSANGSQAWLAYISTFVAFITFVAVVFVLIGHRIFFKVKESRRKKKEKLEEKSIESVRSSVVEDEPSTQDHSMTKFTQQEVKMWRSNSRFRESTLGMF